MPNRMKIRFWLFRSLRNCSCLAFRPVGNSCHRPKVRMARSISSLIAKSDKQVSRSRTKARYAGPSVLTARLRSQIRIGKYAAAGSRKRPFRYQYHSFGGRISSPQIAQRPSERVRPEAVGRADRAALRNRKRAYVRRVGNGNDAGIVFHAEKEKSSTKKCILEKNARQGKRGGKGLTSGPTGLCGRAPRRIRSARGE